MFIGRCKGLALAALLLAILPPPTSCKSEAAKVPAVIKCAKEEDKQDEVRTHETGILREPLDKHVNSPDAEEYYSGLLDKASQSDLPTEILYLNDDLRTTKVRSQGDCDSSWAYAVAGVIEGQEWRFSLEWENYTIPLSAQVLLDCGPFDCHNGGGDILWALDNANWYGLESDCTYGRSPEGHKGVCKKRRELTLMGRMGDVVVKKGEEMDEQSLIGLLSVYGPLIVTMNGKYLEELGNRILPPKCDGRVADHAVLLIGITTDKGIPIYIIKNSWGTKWGRSGFGTVQRNHTAGCSVFGEIIFPIMRERLHKRPHTRHYQRGN